MIMFMDEGIRKHEGEVRVRVGGRQVGWVNCFGEKSRRLDMFRR